MWSQSPGARRSDTVTLPVVAQSHDTNGWDDGNIWEPNRSRKATENPISDSIAAQDTASRSTALHAAAKAGNVATTRALLKSSLSSCCDL